MSNKNLIILLSVFIITVLSYSNSINNGFVNRDDDSNVYNNEDIKGITTKNLNAVFTKSYLGMYTPLTMLSYAIDYSIADLDPRMYHLTNLLLHLFNVIFVFFLFLLISKRFDISIIVSVLFGIHPINVESVSSISVRGGLLYTFFYLLSIIAYLFYLTKGYKKNYLIISLILFLFSLLSKSAAVVLPILLILVDIYFGRRINIKIFFEKILFVLLALVTGIFTYFTRANSSGLNDLYYSCYDKIVLSFYGIYFYFINAFIPHGLSTYLPIPIKNGNFYPVKFYIIPIIVTISGYIVFKLLKAKKFKDYKRDLIFGLSFFLIHILIVLIRPFYFRELVAARYAYLPYLGIFFIIARIFSAIVDKYPIYRGLITVTLIIIVIFFSGYTYSRNYAWKNSVTLWTYAINNDPKCPYNYLKRGFSKGETGEYRSAIEDYNTAIKLMPEYYEPYYSRGIMKYNIGDLKGALTDYDKAIKLSKNELTYFKSDCYNNRGKVKLDLGNKTGAIADFTISVIKNPNNELAYYNRGYVELLMKDYKDALFDFNKTLSINPNNNNAYFSRGYIFYIANDFNKSIKDFTKAIELNNNDFEAYFYRANSKFSISDNEGACNDWKIAYQGGYKEAGNLLYKNCGIISKPYVNKHLN